MRKTTLLFAGIAMIFATACDQKKTEEVKEEAEVAVEETTASEETNAEEASPENPEGYYGEMIDEGDAKFIDEFASMMEGKDSLQVKIRAVASEVCQKKGCWMKVQTADGGSMRIRFKDYGFFVPMDITGKEVIFEGVAFNDTVSVEDLKHYAEDGGETAEAIAAITEPEIKTSFLADGVMIVQ